MEKDNVSDKLKKLLNNDNSNYRILEEQIDINLQIEFFELNSKIIKDDTKIKDLNSVIEKLFDKKSSIEEQKILLTRLSNSEKPEAYRAIEKYIKSGNNKLKNWSILAFQHCRISLESYLLNEQQVYISTGLGGKNQNLRYFIVCKFKIDSIITDTQKKLIQTEFEFSFNKNKSEIEKVHYFNNYFSVIGLIHIDLSINKIIKKAIHEINNYGGFIYDEYLVTNVKILNLTEIENYFKNKGI